MRLIVLLSGLLVCVPLNALHQPNVDLTPNALERKIYEYKPSTPLKTARSLAFYIYHFCDSSLWYDAIRIAYIESSFQQVTSATNDHGYMQLNEFYHGKVGLAHPVQQVDYACKLMKKAVDTYGDISYYHSKTPSLRKAYLKRLRRLR